MTDQQRQQRLATELECLRALKKMSTIFDFECTGTRPERYTIIFRGRGLARDTSAHSNVEETNLHKIELRLPYSYPKRPPDIRWTTPVFHPNVSYSGFINLNDIGLPWEQDLGLDVVCERLWDVARMAFMNVDKAANHAAKSWVLQDCGMTLPIDSRPLRDRSKPSGSNVVRYERRGGRRIALPPTTPSSEVLFIGEDTPTPQLPVRRAPAHHDDDDVLYIGDD